MAGVPLDQRRLLGHHVHDAAKSTETYSREVLYPAARSLEEVLLAIRDGSFKPDEPTTRRFAGPSDTLGLTTSASTASQSAPPASAPQATTEPLTDPDTDSDTSSADTSEDLPEQLPVRNHRLQRPLLKTLPVHAQAWSHIQSGCLHIIPGGAHEPSETFFYAAGRDPTGTGPQPKSA